MEYEEKIGSDLEQFQDSILNDVSDKIVLQKARQVGGTTAFTIKCLELIKEEEVDIAVLKPSVNQARDFVSNAYYLNGIGVKEKGNTSIKFEEGVLSVFPDLSSLVGAINRSDAVSFNVLFMDDAGMYDSGMIQYAFDTATEEGMKFWLCGTPDPRKPNDNPTEFEEFTKRSDFSQYRVSMVDVDHLDEEYIKKNKKLMDDVSEKTEVDGEFSKQVPDTEHGEKVEYGTERSGEGIELNVLDEVIINGKEYTVKSLNAEGRRKLDIELVNGTDVE